MARIKPVKPGRANRKVGNARAGGAQPAPTDADADAEDRDEKRTTRGLLGNHNESRQTRGLEQNHNESRARR